MEKKNEILFGTMLTYILTCVVLALIEESSKNASLISHIIGWMGWIFVVAVAGCYILLPNALIVMYVASFFRRINIISVAVIIMTVIVTCSLTSLLVDPTSYKHYFPAASTVETWKSYIVNVDWFVSKFNRNAMISGGLSSLLVFCWLRIFKRN